MPQVTAAPAAPSPTRRRSRYGALRRGALALASLAAAACTDTTTAPTTLRFQANPCLPADTVSLLPAQATRIDCGNGGTTVTLAGNGASYLVVPEFATDAAPFALVTYSVATGEVIAPSAAVGRISAAMRGRAARSTAGSTPVGRPSLAQLAADRMLRERGERAAVGSALRGGQLRAPSSGSPPLAPPPLGSIRSFHVLGNFSTNPTFTTVGGRLAYVGDNLLLYVDTLAPANGFTPTQLTTFGQYFDQTLWPIDTTAFGSPTDIDANGRVLMLMTPIVNAEVSASTCTSQGYVAGFFEPDDFNTTDPNSNQGEIFYSIVPDTTGQFSCAHGLGEVDRVVPSVFLHEMQHLINFSQHVVVSGGSPGASWMDEGLSLVAEELGSLYYEQKCPPPSCRTDPAQLFPDSSQGFINEILFDSYQFALLPDTASLTLSNDGDLGFSWRGGVWLLMRWLGDQMGGGVYRSLERGPSGGVADIEQVKGQSFPSLFADFGLALYTDSLPGLPRATAPAVDRFTSRNLKQMWARLFTTSGPSTAIPLENPVQLFSITSDTSAAVLFPGTVTYFVLDTPASAATMTIRFAGPGGSAFSSSLKPQIAIFRLPPGQ